MISTVRTGGHLSLMALASGLGIWVLSVSSGIAGDGIAVVPPPRVDKVVEPNRGCDGPGLGTLGYGRPGLYPGFQGFGLGYHLGYGYGGDALGVGAGGGYPFYGGPGYPHPWPRLRRIGGITPFCYFGGPGYPSPEHPNYFGGVGPLSPDQPVVTYESDPRDPAYNGGYGRFDGTLPYPESAFAPFATIAGAGGTASGVSTDPPTIISPDVPPDTRPSPPPMAPPMPGPRSSVPSVPPAPGRLLGIEVESMVDASGNWGLKVSKVYPRTAAERAGLHAGDVILSINGYLTTKPIDLAWVIANPSSNKVLRMSVRTATDREVRTVTAQLP